MMNIRERAELLERALDALEECRTYLDRVEGEGEGGISDFDVASEACRAVLSDAEKIEDAQNKIKLLCK